MTVTQHSDGTWHVLEHGRTVAVFATNAEAWRFADTVGGDDIDAAHRRIRRCAAGERGVECEVE